MKKTVLCSLSFDSGSYHSPRIFLFIYPPPPNNFQPSHLQSKIKELSLFHLGSSWMEDYLKIFYLGKGSFDFHLWHKLHDCHRRHWTIWPKHKLREIAVLLKKSTETWLFSFYIFLFSIGKVTISIQIFLPIIRKQLPTPSGRFLLLICSRQLYVGMKA